MNKIFQVMFNANKICSTLMTSALTGLTPPCPVQTATEMPAY
jgi:hypothetical protein